MSTELKDELHELSKVLLDVLGDHCTPERLADLEEDLDVDLWAALADLGFTLLGTPEGAGGSGGGLHHAALLLRLAAASGAQVPFAEHALAGWLIGRAGLTVPEGVLTIGPAGLAATSTSAGWRVTGSLPRVPYGRQADVVVAVADGPDGDVVVAVPAAGAEVTPGRNLAAEPRDRMTFDVVVPTSGVGPVAGDLASLQRIARAAMIAGACEQAVAMSVQHAVERQQFGRPVAAFQAVQHLVAAMAVETGAVRAAVDAAIDLAEDDLPGLELASHSCTVAAVRAARVVAASAHQVHGAMGFTREHALRLVTTRLWSWREEWGNEPTSLPALGRLAVGSADDLWALVVPA